MSTTINKKPKMEETEVTQVVDLDDDDDDYTPISKKGDTKRTAISVEHYSEEKDLYLAIMNSLQSITPSHRREKSFIDLSRDYDYIDDDIRVLHFTPQIDFSRKRRKKHSCDSVIEKGQSSKSHNEPDIEFVCEICVESKSQQFLFPIKGCSHAYCNECIVKYVASKLQDNICNIPCPVSDCKGSLDPEYCRAILPQDVFDRWGNALCEAVILGSQKVYCPFKDCSAMMLIDDNDDGGRGGEIIRESLCPNCWRMFCLRCNVPWHSGIGCEEFQVLHKDEREREDIMLMELAENKHWRRCPKCRIYVERTQGCKYMRCRCGTSFCYDCGTVTADNYCFYCKG
uniref:RBR-type E3 ubiquitin transferase n=2 Tax=Rhizophora mucronata TaxID=61149 RepID=A0A2P2IUP4_RHIMU